MASVRPFSSRYLWARLSNALETVLGSGAGAGAGAGAAGGSSAVAQFAKAFEQPLTTTIAVTGAAMAPAINAAAVSEPSAYEKLVVRMIARPSSRSVAVGDVVAFSSPLDPASSHATMVRRVAALENHPMLSSEDDEVVERVPLGHCWVLADNEQLTPPDVIDSRAFGYLDMRLITGRVIYQVSGRDVHGPVANSPQSEAADAAVLASEVDVDALASSMPAQASSGGGGSGSGGSGSGSSGPAGGEE